MTVWWMPTWWMLVDHPGVFDGVSTPGWSSWLEDIGRSPKSMENQRKQHQKS